jgi:uncharacterized protein YjiS (DUF1127 family)
MWNRKLVCIPAVTAGETLPESLSNPYSGDTQMFADSLISTFRAWHNRSRVSYELSSMSDRQLADIGISRNDIDAVVSGRLVRRGSFPTRS